MYPPIVYDLGHARLAEFHRQARRDALTRAARRARRQQSGQLAPGLLAVVTRRARPGPSRRRALDGAQVVIDQVPSA